MTYSEYLDKFHEAQLAGRFSDKEYPWSEEDFKFFSTPLPRTPDLKDDPKFRLSYKSSYLNLRKAIEGGMAHDKEEQLKELDRVYQETASKLNLL